MPDPLSLESQQISDVLRRTVSQYKAEIGVEEVGEVLECSDGIARVKGLPNCMAEEMLEFPNGIFGMALNLEKEQVGTVILAISPRCPKAISSNAPGACSPCRWARNCSAVSSTPSASRSTAKARSTRRRCAHRRPRPERHRTPAGQRAAPDRLESHRLHDSHRTRPA